MTGNQTQWRRGLRGLAMAYPRTMGILSILALFSSLLSMIITRDLLVRCRTQVRLQFSAQRAAAAGAAYLPGAPADAIRAAARAAARSGVPGSEIVYAGVTPDLMSFRVKLKCAAPVLLLGLFGKAGADVTVMVTIPAGRPHLRSPHGGFTGVSLPPGAPARTPALEPWTASPMLLRAAMLQ